MVLTAAEKATVQWERIANDILLLDDDDIKFLREEHNIKNLRFFFNATNLKRLDGLRMYKNGLYYSLQDFLKYIIGYRPSEQDVIRMSYEDYTAISIYDINAKYEKATKRKKNTKVSSAILSPPTTISVAKMPMSQKTTTPTTKSSSNVPTTTIEEEGKWLDFNSKISIDVINDQKQNVESLGQLPTKSQRKTEVENYRNHHDDEQQSRMSHKSKKEDDNNTRDEKITLEENGELSYVDLSNFVSENLSQQQHNNNESSLKNKDDVDEGKWLDFNSKINIDVVNDQKQNDENFEQLSTKSQRQTESLKSKDDVSIVSKRSSSSSTRSPTDIATKALFYEC